MEAEYIKREDARTLLLDRLIETANNNTGYQCDSGVVYQDAAERLRLYWLNEVPAADVVPRELYQRALSDVVTLSVERKKTDTTNCMCCYFCGAPLRWEADFSFNDYGIDDQKGVVSDYSCDNCDTSYQIFKPFKIDEREDN